KVHGSLSADYGTVRMAAAIQSYVAAGAVPPRLGRDPWLHGTHVASIAAGRKVGAFSGGVAPEARLVVVIPKLKAGPGDPVSIGYSHSHVDALAYIKEVAGSTPVVVNVSLGMNAGAHDGTSRLEAAFEEFAGGGREPGLIVVKSAGNERGWDGHAKLTLGAMGGDTLRWQADPSPRTEDLIELWFRACDEMKFRLRDPAGGASAQCMWSTPTVSGTFPSGNTYALSFTRYHRDNGDSRLLVLVRPGAARAISPGVWEMEIE